MWWPWIDRALDVATAKRSKNTPLPSFSEWPPFGTGASASDLFRVPNRIDERTAAAGLLKACTAEFLVERCARVEAGWPVLVHAAAGGVGLLLAQSLRHVGAEVIGTVSTQKKGATARGAGADHIILYSE